MCCKAGSVVWYGDGGDGKDGEKDGGGWTEDGEMGTGDDVEGQGEERVHLGTAKIRRIGEKLRGERLTWFGHVKRREESYIGRRMMKNWIAREFKREAAEAVEWQYKGGYEKGGCQWRGGGGPGEVENGDALLRPLRGKAKKKKFAMIASWPIDLAAQCLNRFPSVCSLIR